MNAPTHRERFHAVMEYQSCGLVPNWEAGAWAEAVQRWAEEAPDADVQEGYWFPGCDLLGLDEREFTPFKGEMLPPFEEKTLEEDDETIVFQDAFGRIRRGLKNGASMDTYMRHAVENMSDWQEVKQRFVANAPERYTHHSPNPRIPDQDPQQPTEPVIFGPNTQTMGFYWVARDLLGTEGISYAWYDEPSMMHDMMEFWSDFLIEAMRPVITQRPVDYICFAEDLSMKNGPLLSPDTYREFILPNLERVIRFAKENGVRYICIDTDGNPEALIPMMLDVGVDAIWPLERAAEQDPIRLRQTFGKSLRLWGGVDKRELTKDHAAIEKHLETLAPLIEEGGYIPTVDHTVPPDVSFDNLMHYAACKKRLLAGQPISAARV